MNSNDIQLKRIKKHEFDEWSLKLMNKPYNFDAWQCKVVGENNEGVYRNEYQKLPIADKPELLVPCPNFGLVSHDYYFNVLFDEPSKEKVLSYFLKNKLLYPFAWLRESVATRLQKIDMLLRKHDLFIDVVSGWRDKSIQSLSAELISKEFGEEYVKKAIAEVPTTPHSTGGAFDLELWSLQTNQPLSYSYPGDVINAFVLEQKEKLDSSLIFKRNIRRILFHLLTNEGYVLSKNELFTVHPGEFWHFGDGDPLSSYLSGQNYAKYGYVTPPKNFKIHGH